MLIKKPYAFLIKNFRVINGLLFVMLAYLTLKLFSIYSFFSDYAVSHYYINTGNLDSEYVNLFMFIVTILVTLFSLVIAYLLNVKRKENRSYIFLVIYNLIICIYFFSMFKTFAGLNVNSIEVESVRFYRDISLLVLLPELIFTVIIFGRTLGFNLKQFDFKADAHDLNIDNTDNEEIELSLGNDTYKIKRYIRKLLRLSKYFVLENKLFVIGFSSVIVLIICTSIFMGINVYNTNYEENTKIVANSIWYQVKGSYITKTDMNNKVISEGKTYLVINLNVENKFDYEYTLTRESFRLESGKDLLFPIFSLENSFKDYGEVFTPKKLMNREKKNIVVVFEIDNKKVTPTFTFKIKNYNNLSLGELKSEYKDIILKPYDVRNIKDIGHYNLPANIDFKDTILNNSSIKIDEYMIKDSFSETANVCVKEKCNKINYYVSPNNIGKGDLVVLRIKNNLTLDNDLYLNKYKNSKDTFLENYGYLEYEYLDKKFISYMERINVNYNKDEYSYLQVNKNLKYADKIDLIILIRGYKYIINLK